MIAPLAQNQERNRIARTRKRRRIEVDVTPLGSMNPESNANANQAIAAFSIAQLFDMLESGQVYADSDRILRVRKETA